MELYTVPNEVISFIKREAVRFNIGALDWYILEQSAKHVIQYVSKAQFYPSSAEEACNRYKNPGLSFPEKVQLIGPVEYATKGKYDVNTVHFIVWAALMWCWSEEGTKHLVWYAKTMEAPSSSWQQPRDNVAQLPMVVNGS